MAAKLFHKIPGNGRAERSVEVQAATQVMAAIMIKTQKSD
jgi:hypothetical protein